jgi:hypothetical protein
MKERIEKLIAEYEAEVFDGDQLITMYDAGRKDEVEGIIELLKLILKEEG